MRTALNKLYAGERGVVFSIPDSLAEDTADAVEAAVQYFMDAYWPDIRDLVTRLEFSMEGCNLDASDMELCAVYPKDLPAMAEEDVEGTLENFSYDMASSCCGYGHYENDPVVVDGAKVKCVKVETWAIENWYQEYKEQIAEDEEYVIEAEEAPKADTLVDTDFGLRFGDPRNWLFN